MLIVAVITGATLVVTKNKVEEAYQEFLREQFQNQVVLFYARQEAALASIKQEIFDATNSVRLIAALEEKEAERFYKDMDHELRNLTRASDSEESPFIRFISIEGVVLEPPESEKGLPSGVNEAVFQERMNELGAHVGEIDDNKLGYFTLDGSDGEARLYQVVLSPFIDRFNDELLGVLVIGFPMSAQSGMAGSGKSDIKSGLLVGDFLSSSTIPSKYADDLLMLIRDAERNPTSEPPQLEIDSEPHLVFNNSFDTGAGFPPVEHVSLFSLADSFALLDQIERTVILLGAVAFIVALGLSLFVSHGMTKPILELVRGTEEIQRGNFEHRIGIRSMDEIGLLTRSFNEMSAELALKERLRSVLDKVTDKDVAEQLMKGSVELGGELRDISVLFCDIRGFTPLTEGMPPAEVINILNEHMTAITKVVHTHRGVVDKFVGDEIMVIFGAPRSYGDDTLNAAKCALAMVGEREKLNDGGQYQIEIGLGLASGEMVAGNMGSEDRLNYTVLGEQVNLASRLCSTAGPMEVMIDSVMEERLRGIAEVELQRDLMLKGFKGKVTAYSLISVSPEEVHSRV